MDWEFVVSEKMSTENFLNIIKQSFVSPTVENRSPQLLYLSGLGFSCSWEEEREEDKNNQFSNYYVIKDNFGLKHTYRCYIQVFSSYSGDEDNLWYMMRFIGNMLKQTQGDTLLIFNGEKPIVYRHYDQICVAPGV